MPAVPFPLPVSLFSRDLIHTCSAALEDAWGMLGPARERFILTPEVARLAMATGIVIAATLGIRDQRRLVKSALEHLEQVTARCLPPLEPFKDESNTTPRSPQRYRNRAEELRAIAETARDQEAKKYLVAISADYERMALSADRIEISRNAIDKLSLSRPA